MLRRFSILQDTKYNFIFISILTFYFITYKELPHQTFPD